MDPVRIHPVTRFEIWIDVECPNPSTAEIDGDIVQKIQDQPCKGPRKHILSNTTLLKRPIREDRTAEDACDRD